MNIKLLLLIGFFINTVTTTIIEGKKSKQGKKNNDKENSLSFTITNSSMSTQPIYYSIQTAHKKTYKTKISKKKRHKPAGWTIYTNTNNHTFGNRTLTPNTSKTLSLGKKNGTQDIDYQRVFVSLEPLDLSTTSTQLRVVHNFGNNDSFTYTAKQNIISFKKEKHTK